MRGNEFDQRYLAVGKFRTFSPAPQELAQYPGTNASNYFARFALPLLDVRCRVNVRVVKEFESINNAATGFPLFSIEQLWVALRTKTIRRGDLTPTRNVVGTQAAPLSLLGDVNIKGYEFTLEEVGGDADGICARDVMGEWYGFGNGASGPYAGRVYVSATYQTIHPVTDEEWARVVQRAAIRVIEKRTY